MLARQVYLTGLSLILPVFVVQAAWGQTVIIGQAQAKTIATQKGWPIRLETRHGVIELQAIVNGVPKYYMTNNAVAADSISTDELLPGGSSGLDLTGSGVMLAVWDAGGVRTSHQEYGGRAVQIDSPSGTHYHSTHVAGTMIASGVVSSAKGMSPSADLDCYEWNSDTSEMQSAAAAGLLVSSHSYTFITGWYYDSSGSEWYWYGDVTVSTVEDNWFGLYTSYTEELDDIAHDYPNYLICRAAGNDRDDDGPEPGGEHYYWDPDLGDWEWSTDTRDPDGLWDCIGTQAIAKNVLAVAAVDDVIGGYTGPGSVSMSSFSSWGPADDGRIKPDIAGNGIQLYSTMNGDDSDYSSLSGTSMSTPNVSGSLGVLIQHWRSTHPSEEDMRSATLKGLVLHTADEAGSADGPDYKYGWGLMNTLTAANVISDDVSEPITISEQILNDGNTVEVIVATDGSADLRATICWTDPPGTPPGSLLNPPDKMLVNDLDLRIIKASPSTTYYPWVLDPASPDSAATTGDNDTDNVEQVVVYSPGSNEYTVQVTHEGTLSGGSQAVSLIITGASSGCQDDQDCDDGLYCNGEETCVGGQCQAGTAIDCSDAVGCTDDSCNEGTDSCDNVPNDSLCDDGLYCSGAETCDALLDCQAGTAVDCTDGVGCTDDSCNEGTDSCDNVPNDSLCDDGLYCNGAETCDALLDCQAGTAVDCDDSVGCTDDSCNEGTDSCDNVPNDANCPDDGLYCTGTEFCDAALDCSSTGDPCQPTEFCNETTDTCDECQVDGDCDDTNPCTDDTCVGGSCVVTFIGPRIGSLEVFYAGKFSDEADASRLFLANGSTATTANITNYAFGITGIRVFFDKIVVFSADPKDAFTFEWTTDMGTTFEPVSDVATAVTVTTAEDAGRTVATIVIVDDYVRKRWLKVTVVAAQVSAGGCDLDGELSGNPVSLPSGDGAAGGNAVFYLGNLPGEVTDDQKVLFDDVAAVRAEYNPFLPVPITNVWDVDKDGKVLFADVGATRAEYNPFFTLPLILP